MSKTTKAAGGYLVVNPRGIPKKIDGQRIPIFRQMVGDELRAWYEGDVYDGPSPEEPLRRGFIVGPGDVEVPGG